MKKKKWNRFLAVVLLAAMAASLLSGCGKKSREQENKETIRVYLWTTNLYEKYAPYIQSQLPDVNIEFVVGNNDLDFIGLFRKVMVFQLLLPAAVFPCMMRCHYKIV